MRGFWEAAFWPVWWACAIIGTVTVVVTIVGRA